MSRKISCSILTPEKFVYEGETEFAVVQAYNGEMGFLLNHAPLIAELGTGEIRLRDKDSAMFFVVEGGIVEIRNNNLIVLAESAVPREDLDVDDLEDELKELKSMEFEPFSDERFEVQQEIERTKIKLKVARKR